MKETRVASRYAKSLLDLALEQGNLEQAKNDMKFVLDTCKANKDFVLFLNNPIIKTDKKLSVLKEIFGNELHKISYSFLEIITRKKREEHIETIAEEFLNQYKTHKKILTAVITTAAGLDERLKKKVLEIVDNSAKSEIELIEKQNKNLIGGFVLQLGDKQIDSSIAGKITRLRRDFSENPYIKEY